MGDETKYELIPGGATQDVEYDQRFEYVSESIYMILKQCMPQAQAIRRGIAKIIPDDLLQLITAKEIEVWVSGKKVFDVELLKKNTKYSDKLSESSDLIKNFWKVLTEMSPDDQAKFLKFCWAQERLPTEFKSRFLIMDYPLKKGQRSRSQETEDMILP